MTADTIKTLAECIPDHCAGRRYAPPSVVLGPDKMFGFPVDRGLNVFVQLYKNTAIGWQGLDHFGRILFLFYWKPQDFEKLYGADDLANLEQELLSQFKSFGDVLLQLIKKNETKTGSVPTP